MSHERQLSKKELLVLLQGGDRRSIGKVDDVIKLIKKSPSLFSDLFEGFYSDSSIVRMRTADAVEKISRVHPEYLSPYRKQLINEISDSTQKEVRWHLAQIFPRLKATGKEKEKIIKILFHYLDDNSKIVQTCSIQALSDLALHDAKLRKKVIPLLKKLSLEGSPAVKNRAGKLWEKLGFE